MADGKLAANHCYQISEICAMAHITQQRFVLVINRLPVCAMHVWVVEILPLNAPGFSVDLRPLSSRIDTHLELSDVEWAIANFCRPLRGNNPPTVCTVTSLVQKLFLVG